MISPLKNPQLSDALTELPGWEQAREDTALKKSFKFKDFNEAWAFMNRIALLAEKMDHHPEWSNTYNRVNITLSTHEAGGITDRDIQMAIKIESFL